MAPKTAVSGLRVAARRRNRRHAGDGANVPRPKWPRALQGGEGCELRLWAKFGGGRRSGQGGRRHLCEVSLPQEPCGRQPDERRARPNPPRTAVQGV
eukprot:289006-Prymnesium_polylepis.1